MSSNKVEWTTEDWAKKLKQQAGDSREYRHKLYNKVDLRNKNRILDVGCGTGAVTLDIAENTHGEVVAIDNDEKKLEDAIRLLENLKNVKVQKADAENLPFPDEHFDLVVCNIVLIHVNDQQKAVSEMARVTKSGGVVLATLEPDYDAIIQYPDNPVTPLIHDSLKELGADMKTGRRLKMLFTKTGLKTEVGIDTESEFLLINDDEKRLKIFLENFWVPEKIMKKHNWTDDQIEKYKSEQIDLIESGREFYFMTAFYAIGRKI